MKNLNNDPVYKALYNIKDGHELMPEWRVDILSVIFEKHGVDPWISKKRRCPKCSSDKWKEIQRYNSLDIFDIVEIYIMGGHEFTPHLLRYKCDNCGEEFSFWEHGCFFESPLKGRCYKCRSREWNKIEEKDNTDYFICKHCGSLIVLFKKLRNELM